MKWVFILILFTTSCVIASSQVGTRCKLIDELKNNGLHLGYNEGTGDLVVIAGSSVALYGDEKVPSLLWKSHKIAFHQAILKACRELSNNIFGRITGSNKIKIWRNAEKWLKMNESRFQKESQVMIRGFEILAMETSVFDKKYNLKIAVTLNLHRINRLIETGDLVCPASEWKSEFQQYIKKMNAEEISPSGYFVDSNGFYHAYGLEVGDIVLSSPRQRSVSLKIIEMRAQANLQLLLNGVVDAGQQMESTMVRGADMSRVISKNMIGHNCSHAEGENIMGCNVFEGLLYSRLIKRKLYVIAYAAVPNEREVRNIQEKEAYQKESAEGTRVKVFNPHTGKFE